MTSEGPVTVTGKLSDVNYARKINIRENHTYQSNAIMEEQRQSENKRNSTYRSPTLAYATNDIRPTKKDDFYNRTSISIRKTNAYKKSSRTTKENGKTCATQTSKSSTKAKL